VRDCLLTAIFAFLIPPRRVVAVPLLVTFRMICAHLEALSPFGEFLAQTHAANPPGDG
jgi:hypothetical protein